MKSGKKTFTKIRKWAAESGAIITESKYFDAITIEYNGNTFKAEMKESTSSQVVSPGRGLKWAGSPAGFYFGTISGSRYGYTFESTQSKAIEEMEKSK